jgi:HEAT repeat protein
MRARAWFPLVLLAASCGEPPDAGPVGGGAAATAAPAPGAGFGVWHEDFPYQIRLSPDAGGKWYGRTRRQALEQIVERLEGSCTHEAWKAAQAYFRRAPAAAIGPLIAALDAAMQRPERADMVENTVEALGAMGRYRDPAVTQALLRAFEHPKDGIRSKVMRALIIAGDAGSVRATQGVFGTVDRRDQVAWIEAARAHLSPAELEPMFRDILTKPIYGYLRPIAMRELNAMPPADAVTIVAPLWDELPLDVRLSAAVVLHRAGDARGTFHLRQLLHGESPLGKIEALGILGVPKTPESIDEVLKLTADEAPSVRQATVAVLYEVPGENVDNALSVLGLDPHTEVRREALRALCLRGVRPLLDELIERVKAGSGTMLRTALLDLMAAGDARALPAIVERMKASPIDDIRMYLQGLANSRIAAAFDVLMEVFNGTERALPETAGETTVTYVAIIVANLREGHARLPEAFAKLAPDDYRRRAALIFAMASAALIGEPELRGQVFALLRRIVADRSEIPQMRLHALHYLQPDITLDDVAMLAGLQEGESEAMRKALTNYLFEFF